MRANNSERATDEEEQTVEFDDVENDESAIMSSITMKPSSCRSSQPEMMNTSESIMHKHS